MTTNNQKITFIPFNKNAENFIPPPKPASEFIPQWYKDSSVTPDGSSRGLADSIDTYSANTTVKACIPFLDTLTAGYMWTCPSDIEVTPGPKGGMIFKWLISENLIGGHSIEQAGQMPDIAEVSDGGIYKWIMPFGIKTPRGYSTLFTHPLNRYDLSFRTMSGIVDTDNYHIPVNFPFKFIQFTGERMIIEKGTPLCQIIPFKREVWVSNTKKYNKDFSDKSMYKLRSKIVRSYQSNFWVKKTCR